jgi:hypothetical protein
MLDGIDPQLCVDPAAGTDLNLFPEPVADFVAG